MNKETLNFAKRLLVDSIWKSANLEGLGTTFPKTEAILENIPTETKREEVLFIVNMKRAWDFLLQNVDYNNCFMLLREYNKIVGDNLFYGSGEIRKSEVFIGGTTWKPSIPLEDEIYEKLKELNSINDIELKALKYFCYVARTQMFIDGNKRVAQLIANKILIENDIGVFQIPVDAIEAFKGLLLEFYETNNDAEIIEFMKEYCIIRINTGVKKYTKRDTDNKDIVINEKFKLSESQVRILNKILYKLRRELVKRSSSHAELYEKDEDVFLKVDNVVYKMYSGDTKLDKVTEEVINLLVDKIPLPIKKVSFKVSEYDLVYGDIVKSEEEKGSVEFKLW